MSLKPLDELVPAREGSTTVRKFCMADLDRFHAYRSDATLAVYQGWSVMSLEEARRFVSAMSAVTALTAGGWIQLAIADSRSDELVGDLGLYLEADASAGEVGFTLARSAQRQGHATRAVRQAWKLFFAATPVPFVRAATDARNLPSMRVLERAGFVKSEERRSVFKGEPCTEVVYLKRRPPGMVL